MVIKVERGAPTPEELAAVVALVQARAAALASPAEDPDHPNAWSNPARLVPRPVPHPGPAAWRTSTWPA